MFNLNTKNKARNNCGLFWGLKEVNVPSPNSRQPPITQFWIDCKNIIFEIFSLVQSFWNYSEEYTSFDLFFVTYLFLTYIFQNISDKFRFERVFLKDSIFQKRSLIVDHFEWRLHMKVTCFRSDFFENDTFFEITYLRSGRFQNNTFSKWHIFRTHLFSKRTFFELTYFWHIYQSNRFRSDIFSNWHIFRGDLFSMCWISSWSFVNWRIFELTYFDYNRFRGTVFRNRLFVEVIDFKMTHFAKCVFPEVLFYRSDPFQELSFRSAPSTEVIEFRGDHNSNMPFLRNEIPKIFKDLFTIRLFKKITIIYDFELTSPFR